MNTLTELENLIRQWGHDRNLIAGNTVDRQFTKTWEEVLEIKEAIAAENDFELADAIGDTVVTLVLLAAIKDWTLQQCVQQAYDTIKNRTGKTIGGVFIKDSEHAQVAADRDSHTASVQKHVFQHTDHDLDEPLGEPQPCTDGVCESCQ